MSLLDHAGKLLKSVREDPQSRGFDHAFVGLIRRLGYEARKPRRVAMAVIALALLAWHGAAWAGCRSSSLYLPDGSVIVCYTCCWAGQCSTSCT